MVTTKRYKKQQDPKKAEQATAKAAAFREMALLLDGELKAGQHTQRLEQAAREVVGIDRYSPLNQLMILTQCPQATEVHGYVEWQKLGYQVRKGEKAIALRAPHTAQTENGAKIGFHRTYVFDRSQVDPISQQDEKALEILETPGSDQEDQEPEAAPAVAGVTE